VTDERWPRVKALFQAAVERPPGERDAFLAAATSDEAVRREVASLLTSDTSNVSFLDQLPVAREPGHADLLAALPASMDPTRPSPVFTAGRRVGPYDIVAPLGAGAMGEVYRAHDTTLNRDVALKVLPELFAVDADRLARFTREAQVLASLNHPNIAAIYGIEEGPADAGHHLRALVLELVEGETLSDRIARGPVPIAEVLTLARQIAEALEAAHEKGIVHRDLKPANIKIAPNGVIKVLDFGLAKVWDGAPQSDLSGSPSLTASDLGGRTILGTPTYMSPEQARGQSLDRRTDLWSFGCVLYEMLTGRRAFEGEDAAETLAFVMARELDWDALPAECPAAIRTLLRRCLEKDPRRRIADISTALFVLDEGSSFASTTDDGGRVVWERPDRRVQKDPVHAQLAWRRVVALTTRTLAVAVVGGAAAWYAMRPPAPRVTRMTITPPAAAALSLNGLDRDLAIAPDGSRLVYVGANGTQLFGRALDALEPLAIFKGNPRGLFVSPDGRWIGFADGNSGLKKVAMSGGPAAVIPGLDGAARGATWTPDGDVIFATITRATGLQRVSAAGGAPEVLTRPDYAQGEADHLWPEMLPGGRAVLFTITAATGGLDAAQVAVFDLQTGTRKVLVRGGSHAQYVSSGHLVYAAAGTLRAIAFDLARLETRGTPVPVVPDVTMTSLGGVDAVMAADGTLAYVAGGGSQAALQRTLVWVSRQGQEAAIPVPPRVWAYPRIAPDGASVTIYNNDQELDLWRWDFTRTTLTRLTFDGGIDAYPAWTPDGRRLVFSSGQARAGNLYWQAADGTGTVERLTESPNLQSVTGVSPDGTRVIFTEYAAKTGEDILQLQLDGRQVTPLVQTPFAERNGIISPDGRWLAFESNDSGQNEVYVRPFPDVHRGHWQVSTGGGTRPLWARSGQELFYLSPSGALMRVGVERGRSWAATAPTMLIKEGYFTVPGVYPGRTYDISPDGQRFLMLKAGGGADQAALPPSLIVVQHFDEELKRLAPPN
jgi:serine/threonine-protein kinase